MTLRLWSQSSLQQWFACLARIMLFVVQSCHVPCAMNCHDSWRNLRYHSVYLSIIRVSPFFPPPMVSTACYCKLLLLLADHVGCWPRSWKNGGHQEEHHGSPNAQGSAPGHKASAARCPKPRRFQLWSPWCFLGCWSPLSCSFSMATHSNSMVCTPTTLVPLLQQHKNYVTMWLNVFTSVLSLSLCGISFTNLSVQVVWYACPTEKKSDTGAAQFQRHQ